MYQPPDVDEDDFWNAGSDAPAGLTSQELWIQKEGHVQNNSLTQSPDFLKSLPKKKAGDKNDMAFYGVGAR